MPMHAVKERLCFKFIFYEVSVFVKHCMGGKKNSVFLFQFIPVFYLYPYETTAFYLAYL